MPARAIMICLRNKMKGPSRVAHTLGKPKQEDSCEFKASLGCRASTRLIRDTEQDPGGRMERKKTQKKKRRRKRKQRRPARVSQTCVSCRFDPSSATAHRWVWRRPHSYLSPFIMCVGSQHLQVSHSAVKICGPRTNSLTGASLGRSLCLWEGDLRQLSTSVPHLSLQSALFPSCED